MTLNKTATTKVAVVGCGYWGKNLVRNFSELGVLSAVCDAHAASADAIAHQYQVASHSLEYILQDESITGVVIAAPAAQHAELARQALSAGKHVFVEKPLALNVEEAQNLCALAGERQRILMVGHLLQYHPAFLALKEMVHRGDLGNLQYIYSNRLNLGKFRTEENILWSFAPHDISVILELVGELPKAVQAVGTCVLSPSIYDVTTTHLFFDHSVQAHIFVSWLHPYKEQKLIVVGSEGMAVFDDGLPWEQKLSVYKHKVEWTNGLPQPNKAAAICIPVESSEPLKNECQHFLESIQKSHKPRTDGAEGLRVLKVLDAAEQSLKTGEKVTCKVVQCISHKHLLQS